MSEDNQITTPSIPAQIFRSAFITIGGLVCAAVVWSCNDKDKNSKKSSPAPSKTYTIAQEAQKQEGSLPSDPKIAHTGLAEDKKASMPFEQACVIFRDTQIPTCKKITALREYKKSSEKTFRDALQKKVDSLLPDASGTNLSGVNPDKALEQALGKSNATTNAINEDMGWIGEGVELSRIGSFYTLNYTSSEQAPRRSLKFKVLAYDSGEEMPIVCLYETDSTSSRNVAVGFLTEVEAGSSAVFTEWPSERSHTLAIKSRD